MELLLIGAGLYFIIPILAKVLVGLIILTCLPYMLIGLAILFGVLLLISLLIKFPALIPLFIIIGLIMDFKEKRSKKNKNHPKCPLLIALYLKENKTLLLEEPK